LQDEEEKRLIAEMLAIVAEHPRYGYRMVWARLRQTGWRVNRKRIYRLWVQEGLKVPQKQRKRRRLGHSENSCVRRKAEHKDHVWTWDFIHDRTTNGRPLKWLSIVDEYTRECLALEVDRSITAEKVIDVLVELFRIRGVPKHIRSDNGPEFIAKAIRRWLSLAGVETLYVEPGSPWENGYAESFHSRLRDELLNRKEFANLMEARHLADAWRLEYNHRQPHSSLGYQTPAEFAAGRAVAAFAPAAPPLQQRRHGRTPSCLPLPVTQPTLS
jgi:putative transposase